MSALQVISLLAALCSAGCTGMHQTIQPQSAELADEYAIYSVVLSRYVVPLALSPRTEGEMPFGSTPDLVTWAMERLEGLPTELIASWRAKNQQAVSLQPSLLRTPLSVRLAVPSDTTDVVSLSRVGFSSDRSQAVLHLVFTCAGLCGGGGVVWLTKTGEKWGIKAERQTLQY